MTIFESLKEKEGRHNRTTAVVQSSLLQNIDKYIHSAFASSSKKVGVLTRKSKV